MKLRNIYIICKETYGDISDLSAVEAVVDGMKGVRVSGWEKACRALLRLHEISALKEDVDNLMHAVPELLRTDDVFSVKLGEWGNIDHLRLELIRSMDNVMALYQSVEGDMESRIGVDIKLPKFNDFSEFVKYLNDLEFVLTKCPFLESADEKLIFDNVDVGSTWLTFFVVANGIAAGSIVLNNIAAFVDKCIIIRSHYLTTKKQKQEIENGKKNEEEKRIIYEYLNEMYKNQVESAIKSLEEITKYTVENKDGDEFKRIERCFELMGEMIDKGLQIQVSIDAPSETKALFKPLEMKYLSVKESLELLEKNEDE